LEDAFCKKFTEKKSENNNMYLKNTLTGNFMDILNSIISNSGVYVSVFLIGLLAIDGKMSIGSVMAVIVLVQRVQWSFIDTSERWGKTVESVGMADRIFEIMDQKTEEEVFYKDFIKAADSKNAISINNASYAYKLENGETNEVIKDFSIEVKYGETLGIVGLSGTGKSTLAKLILGLIVPDNGSVSICGHITSNSLKEARKNVAYIPQVPYLFKESIEQNISYGKENAGKGEIISAAKSAHAHDFIVRLKDGYDSDVGEHGTKLSGGERQRVAIARAFLKGATVIVFDEATSSLDNESERFVQNSIENERGCRTLIIIAHRISTVKNADRIIVIDGGKIIEEGNHKELMGRGTQYKRLCESQIC
jgi:ATP-binding cassette subfamily B protein/subfamily B ATP-binding cassette protein MsbA